MNSHVSFLLHLRRLILLLNQNKDISDAIILKEFILQNAGYFNDTHETITFIDALFYLCEEFTTEKIAGFYAASCSFYLSILNDTLLDVYFCGSQKSFITFKEKISKQNVNLVFFDIEQPCFDRCKIKPALSESRLSLLAYDYAGSHAVLKGDIGQPFAHYLHEDQWQNNHRDIDRYCEFLSYQYHRLMKITCDTIIFGSSYAHHALTHINSMNSLSFSIPGLDIASAHDLFFRMKNNHNASQIILCFGHYDLFKEIKKGGAGLYIDARNSIKKFTDLFFEDKRIHGAEKISDLPSFDLGIPVDDLVNNYYLGRNTLVENEKQSNDANIIANKLDEMQKNIDSTVSLTEEQLYNSGREVVSTHNKYVNYHDSFALNCEKMMEIKYDAEKSKSHVYLLIPPVSRGYSENLESRIKIKARDFFQTLDSDFFHLVDFATDERFNHTDFIDGHHLNIYGAKKLQSILFNRGVLSQREL
ncbi:hypothetical protein [Citrobacter sp. RHBSTW-00671]|uniref:hypothetical protein n=1 Tax=Citrobacter sp. RHBSTW-00671 TaxID=2742660 RepID=UPI0017A1E0EB|nr:hypothetical protein [Citrobacter sp. RHBSTW-00671]MBA7968818.1 hypothetical protein [Citrobacter sp. RHBSTW-00671]HCJ6371857.1 hypothetical protein [Citrobacter freundii]